MRNLALIGICLSLAACASTPKNADSLRKPSQVPTDSELTFKSLGEATAFAPACFPGQTGSVTLQTYEYKAVVDPDSKKLVHLRAYVFRPPQQKDHAPVLAMFNGGAWRVGNPTAWFPQALYFASRGMVGVAFQYREQLVHGLPSPDHPNIAERATNDARSSLLWLRDHANDLNIDLNRVAVVGDSAGGHLALITSLVDSVAGEPAEKTGLPLAPKAIVAFYPVVDTANMLDMDGTTVLDFTKVSPLQNLSADRPLPDTQLIFGAADRLPWTPPAKSLAFCQRANEIASNSACVTDEIPEPPGASPNHPVYDHGSSVHAPQYRRFVSSMDHFLTAHGLVDGDPAASDQRMQTAADLCVSTKDQVKAWTHQMGYDNHGGVW